MTGICVVNAEVNCSLTWHVLLPDCMPVQASDCHKAGDMEQAERLYKKALDLRPHNAKVHQLLGALLIQRYRTGEVRLSLLRSTSLDITGN